MLCKDRVKPASTYLFLGPRGVGKTEVAKRFAACLLSDEANNPEDHFQRAFRGVHPDLRTVTGSETRKSSEKSVSVTRGVEAVRWVIESATVSPLDAPKKVFLFPDTDWVNETSFNALLKTLEEPTSTTVIILCAESEEALLPTVVSRCRVVQFGRVPEEEMKEGLIKQEAFKLLEKEPVSAKSPHCEDKNTKESIEQKTPNDKSPEQPDSGKRTPKETKHSPIECEKCQQKAIAEIRTILEIRERLAKMAKAAGGRPGLAIRLLTNQDVEHMRTFWLSLPTKLSPSPGRAWQLSREALEEMGDLVTDYVAAEDKLRESVRGQNLKKSDKKQKDENDDKKQKSLNQLRNRGQQLFLSMGLEFLASWYVDAATHQLAPAPLSGDPGKMLDSGESLTGEESPSVYDGADQLGNGAGEEDDTGPNKPPLGQRQLIRNTDVPARDFGLVTPAQAVRNAQLVLEAIPEVSANLRLRLLLSDLFVRLAQE